ncbi:MAG: outer membrane lipid asymmetry maintenance protein MlaD [Geminicoccaceae bacterium]|nr:outer membrane lipid asymmetry maintenance protein MlaD [Geminicoccaceae bacterium]MCB9942624.1 outer membrane lipid asymmetry maintenance protein MlaD [Geminicoccaceae bacterium]
MSRNIVETILGAVVIIVAGGFLTWAYSRSNVGDPGGYSLVAKFDRIDGLDIGSDVRVSGIKVGKILSQTLDPASYRAVVSFSVESSIELPIDSSAAITSSGLLGGKYLALVPGAEDIMLKDGEEVTLTQNSVNLEDLIGQMIFSQANGSR